jgi:hypothetical protein
VIPGEIRTTANVSPILLIALGQGFATSNPWPFGSRRGQTVGGATDGGNLMCSAQHDMSAGPTSGCSPSLTCTCRPANLGLGARVQAASKA